MAAAVDSLWIVALGTTAFASYVFTRAAIAVAVSRGMFDQPGARRSHRVATPTGGGLGLVAAWLLGVLGFVGPGNLHQAWAWGVLPGVAVLAWIGWRDDRRGVSAAARLAVQLAVSLVTVGLLSREVPGMGVVLGMVTLGWLVWSMNLFNFMDGSDGMAGLQAAFAATAYALLFAMAGDALLSLVAGLLAAASLGFLPWNFPRPRVFMGDAGSVAVGFVLAALAAQGAVGGRFEAGVALLPMAVFLVDATLTLASRVLAGERWYTAHKQHVYQRLIAQGWPHRRVAYTYQGVNLALVTPAILLALMYPEQTWLFTGTCFLLLLSGWFVASRKLRMRVSERA